LFVPGKKRVKELKERNMRIDRLIMVMTVLGMFFLWGCGIHAARTETTHQYFYHSKSVMQIELKSKGPAMHILQVFEKADEKTVRLHMFYSSEKHPGEILTAKTVTYLLEPGIIKIAGLESWDEGGEAIEYVPFRTYMQYPLREGLVWTDEYDHITRDLTDRHVKTVRSRIELVGQETIDTIEGPVLCWVTEKVVLSKGGDRTERTYFARDHGLIKKVIFYKGVVTAEVNWMETDKWLLDAALSVSIIYGKDEVARILKKSGAEVNERLIDTAGKTAN
jgi:hypothetical protein